MINWILGAVIVAMMAAAIYYTLKQHKNGNCCGGCGGCSGGCGCEDHSHVKKIQH